MKKMLSLLICIIILMCFLVSCKNNDSKHYYDKNGILELIGANELNCEVIDIEVIDKSKNHTTLFMELFISEKEFLSNNFFHYQEELPPWIEPILIDCGIRRESITNSGYNYKEYIIERKNEKVFHPYTIYWFKLDQSSKNKSHILIYSIIPDEIEIDLTEKTGDGPLP